MILADFNRASREEALALVRPCLDLDRWVDAVVDGRPYADLESLIRAGQQAAHPFTRAEVEQALAHHPRIGDRAAGESTEAALSRSEQAGLGIDADMQRQLAEGNRAYEERFGRVFLIRAAGRSAVEILAALQQRLANDDATEDQVVADQLRQIAVLRLEQAVSR